MVFTSAPSEGQTGDSKPFSKERNTLAETDALLPQASSLSPEAGSAVIANPQEGGGTGFGKGKKAYGNASFAARVSRP